jgi:hypothetical protein
MSEEMQLALEHTLKTMRELKKAADEIERLKKEALFTADTVLPDKDAEIERLRAALREIDQARYTNRNTINPDNAFEHAIALNEKLIAVMDAARAALAEEKPNE